MSDIKHNVAFDWNVDILYIVESENPQKWR